MQGQPIASHNIDGTYVEDASGMEIESVYPATGEVVAQPHTATPQLMKRAISSARDAQKEWTRVLPAKPERILRKGADLMPEHNHELSLLETLDTGKPYQETIIADALSSAKAFEFYGGLAASLGGDCVPSGESFFYSNQVAPGVCVGIGAWNYSTKIVRYKAAAALACGNAVVFNSSEVTLLCALKAAEILTEANLPDGLCNVVQGHGDVGATLVEHPLTGKVSVTGRCPRDATSSPWRQRT